MKENNISKNRELINKIKKAITNGNVEKAIGEIVDIIEQNNSSLLENKEYNDSLILILSQHNALSNEIEQGIHNQDSQRIQENRINSSLFKFLNNLENDLIVK